MNIIITLRNFSNEINAIFPENYEKIPEFKRYLAGKMASKKRKSLSPSQPNGIGDRVVSNPEQLKNENN